MSDSPSLLIEIGCEEIPARMIRRAAAELERRLVALLDDAELDHGAAVRWGGSRRLAARVDAVESRQQDRDELVLGPPAAVAFDADGAPTRAAAGFARKQGVEPGALERHDTERGSYVGLRRRRTGLSLGEVLARDLPAAVAGMSFPKTMRWADGTHRWVRPVHWVVVLHGERELELSLFGVRSGRVSAGHRFLAGGGVSITTAARYEADLLEGRVVVDPDERRRRLDGALRDGAATLDGLPVDDPELLAEVVDLVEWPGVVAGRFSSTFLDLPREILVTTLRHHQKCFSVQSRSGELLPAFLAVANTDRDPAGHVRRGNEWVVGGRLDDATFFWREDRGRSLESLSERLSGVVFHAKVGTFADKAARIEALAARLATAVGLAEPVAAAAARAAALSKNDLLTGTVGEFPELQGRAGGLLVRAEGGDDTVARAIYEQYQPVGPDDSIPSSDAGCVVALADKLDSIASLIGAGEVPTSSRDPLGLRRATSGVFRILLERRWSPSLDELARLASGDDAVVGFLRERLVNFFKDRGAAPSEVAAVLHERTVASRAIHDLDARLTAIAGVRDRRDFAHLVELTKRLETILVRNASTIGEALQATLDAPSEPPAAARLSAMVDELGTRIDRQVADGAYDEVIESMARFIDPVEQFFTDVLVIDPADPDATRQRCGLLARLRSLVTREFDIRHLAGQASKE